MADTELWENATPRKVWVRKHSVNGDLGYEMVASGKRVDISPKERRLNQEMAASEDLDVFHNGVLQPVRLIEGDESLKEIASNPNHLSETDLKDVVRGNHRALDKRLGEIHNPAALQRMLEVAKKEDVRASVMDKIKTRLLEVAPSFVQDVQSMPSEVESTEIRPVTPR